MFLFHGYRSSYPGVMRLGREVVYSPPSIRPWLRTDGPIPYVFMLWTGTHLSPPLLGAAKASTSSFTQSSPMGILLFHVDRETDGRTDEHKWRANMRFFSTVRMCLKLIMFDFTTNNFITNIRITIFGPARK